MPRNLQLQVMLDTIDRATRPLRQITRGTRGASQALGETRDQLRALERAQEGLQGFTRLRRQSETTAASLNEQQQRIRELSRRINTTEGSTRQLTRERNTAIRQARRLTAQYDREQQQLWELRGRLRQVDGVTGSLSEQQRGLARRIEETNRRLGRQRSALERMGRADVTGRFDTLTRAMGQRATQLTAFTTATGAAIGALGHSFATQTEEVRQWSARLGIGVDQLSRLQYAGAQFGVESDAMIDALKELSLRTDEFVITGAGSAAESFERLGLSPDTLDRLSNDTGALFDLVLGRLRELDSVAARQRILDELFGGTGGEQLTELVTVSATEFKRLRQEADAFGATFSQADTDAARDYMRAWRSAGGALLGVRNTLGRALAPALASLFNAFSGWVSENRDQVRDFASVLGNRLKALMPAIIELGRGLATVASTTGQITSALAGLVGGFDNLGIVIASLFALKPVIAFAGLVNAVWGFGAGLVSLIATLPGVSAAFASMGAAITGSFATMSAAIAAMPIGWLLAAIAAIAGIGYLLYKNWSTIGEFFQGLWVDIKAAFSGGLAGINQFLSNWDPLNVFYRRFAGVLSALGVELPETFTEFGATLIAGFNRGLSMAFDAVKTTLLGIADHVVAFGSMLSGFFSGLWDDVRQAFSGGIAGVGELILRWSPVNLFYQAFRRVMNWFGVQLPDTFTAFGSLMINGLKNGILGAFSTLKETVLNAGESVIGWFKDTLGIHSPSRVFAELGNETLNGFQIGLKEAESGTLRQLRGVTDRILRAGAGLTLGGTLTTQVAALPDLSIGGAITTPAIAMADLPRIRVDTPDIDSVSLDMRGPLPATPNPNPNPNPITVQGDNITLNVYPSTGMDERALAAYIERLLDERDQRKAARLRSALHDLD